MKLHARRSCDFASLAKVSNAADVRNTGLGPVKLRGAPFMADPEFPPENPIRRRKADYNLPPESSIRAVRTLTLTYALVSAADEEGRAWRTIDAAYSHLAAVGSMSRLNSRANHALQGRILESELPIRLEWVKMHQTQPTLPHKRHNRTSFAKALGAASPIGVSIVSPQ